jgi:hypothetical protein
MAGGGCGGAGRDYAGVDMDMDASTTRLACDSRAAGMEVEVEVEVKGRRQQNPRTAEQRARHVLGAARR